MERATVVVTTERSNQVLQFQVPLWTLWSGAGSVLLLLLGVSLVVPARWQVRELHQRVESLEAVNDSLREQAAQVDRLEAELNRLATIHAKTRALIGLDAYPAAGRPDAVPGAAGRAAQDSGKRAIVCLPHDGPVSRGFAMGPGDAGHPGLDLAGKEGAPVRAAGAGAVTVAEFDSTYGNVVVINHGAGVESLYGHNQRLLVRVGDRVEAGDTIASLGSTGRSSAPHVHFELLQNGIPVNPESVLVQVGAKR